jgi:hypothetical protein
MCKPSLLALLASIWMLQSCTGPEATDPHHIYVPPREPGDNPNWPNDMRRGSEG